jgi:hypothetical protein
VSDCLEVSPVTLSEARSYCLQFHRHHPPPPGGLFAIACAEGFVIRGVVIVGRPVSRMLQDGYTAEVSRLATDGVKNGCSMLYAAAWRAARAMGYRRLITYILASEPGTSLKASGWKLIGQAGGGSWSRESRPRVDKAPLQRKMRYEIAIEAQGCDGER